MAFFLAFHKMSQFGTSMRDREGEREQASIRERDHVNKYAVSSLCLGWELFVKGFMAGVANEQSECL